VRASEPTSDLCLQLKVMLAMSQVAPEELRALLKNVISEASTDLDVEPSSSDEESASQSSVASDTVQEMETDDNGNEGNRTGAGNAGTDGFTTVKRKRGSHRSKNASKSSKSSKSSNSSYVESKKKWTENTGNQDQDRAHVNLNVYVKGVDFDEEGVKSD